MPRLSELIVVVRLHDAGGPAEILALLAFAVAPPAGVDVLLTRADDGGSAVLSVALVLGAAVVTVALLDRIVDRRRWWPRKARLRVSGPTISGPRPPIAIDRVNGVAIVPSTSDRATLIGFDPRGWVILRVESNRRVLDALDRALSAPRQRFPLEHRAVRVVVGALGAPALAVSFATATGAPRSTLAAAFAIGWGLGLFVRFLPRRCLEVGPDGLLMISRLGHREHVPFEEVSALYRRGDDIVVEHRNGRTQSFRMAIGECGSKVVAVWSASRQPGRSSVAVDS